MKIAVIGASGNAGTRLVREAQSRGHEVTAVTRIPECYRPQGEERVVQGDVQNVDCLCASIKGHEAVISSVTFEAIDPDRGRYIKGAQIYVSAAKASQNTRLSYSRCRQLGFPSFRLRNAL